MRSNRFIAILISLLLTSSYSAQAHAELVSTLPKAGSVIRISPKYIELTFGENLTTFKEKQVNSLKLINGKSIEIPISPIVVAGKSVRAKVTKLLAPGKYTVNYRVVSEDGHVLDSSFKFELRIVK